MMHAHIYESKREYNLRRNGTLTWLTCWMVNLELHTYCSIFYSYIFLFPLSFEHITGKAFDITYVRILYRSPRPESFAISKRTSQNGAWIPYQYYSATCRDTYALPDSRAIRKGEGEAHALCTSEYSDISPLRDGEIAFSSLEGRPGGINFERSGELQVSEV